MYARCAPTVIVGHPPDQLTDFEINSRTARRASSRLPGPEDTEALAMPPDDRICLYDDEGITPVRPNAMKKDPEETVARRKRWAGSLLLEYSELLSQRGVLDREMHAAMEARDECAEQREEGANHARRLRQLDNTDKANSSVTAVRSALWRATVQESVLHGLDRTEVGAASPHQKLCRNYAGRSCSPRRPVANAELHDGPLRHSNARKPTVDDAHQSRGLGRLSSIRSDFRSAISPGDLA